MNRVEMENQFSKIKKRVGVIGEMLTIDLENAVFNEFERLDAELKIQQAIIDQQAKLILEKG